MKNYYEFKPPFPSELKSMFYRVTSVELNHIIGLRNIFLDGRDNSVKDIVMLDDRKSTMYAMAKSAIQVYGYYINYPYRFDNDPANVVAWMLRNARNTFLSINKVSTGEGATKYHKMSNKFIERHMEEILRLLESPARIVARKAKDIEDQRKD